MPSRSARLPCLLALMLGLVAITAHAADVSVRDLTQRLYRSDPSAPIDISYQDLRNLDLSGLDFKGAKLQGSNLFGADLRGSDLSNADLRDARLDRVIIIGARFDAANLAEVVSSAAEFENEYEAESDAAVAPGSAQAPPLLTMLRGYLEAASLVADADAIDPERGAVTLMTLHAAKGLEFDAVAMIGLEDGLLPHSRSRENESELEEERRLCFVGVTRARERLLLTSARLRTMRGIPERTIRSAFIEELGEGLTVSDQSGGFDSYDEEESTWGRSTTRLTPTGGAGHGGIAPGAQVRHPQFGRGRVLSVDGRGPEARAKVQFAGAGTKTLVLKYARREAVSGV